MLPLQPAFLPFLPNSVAPRAVPGVWMGAEEMPQRPQAPGAAHHGGPPSGHGPWPDTLRIHTAPALPTTDVFKRSREKHSGSASHPPPARDTGSARGKYFLKVTPWSRGRCLPQGEL